MNPMRKANSADMSDMTRRNAAGGLVPDLRRPRLLTYVSVRGARRGRFRRKRLGNRGPSLAQPVGLQSFAMNDSTSARPSALGGVPDLRSRTPSFAWQPVRGATRYEFQLSTSDQFRAGNGLVWSSRTLTTPATTIPLSLPWITGDPASLYWHVRAVGGGSVSPWSDAKAVHDALVERAGGVAADEWIAGRLPGYVRWKPVEGATGYQVWFVNANKVITTITNVADEREYYAFHDTPAWTGTSNGASGQCAPSTEWPMTTLPAVSYGPWSADYTWTNTSNPLTSRDRCPRRWRPSRPASPSPAAPVTTALIPAFSSLVTGRRTKVCTGCTSSATATASTSSTAARLSAVPRIARERAGRSSSRSRRGPREGARKDPHGRQGGRHVHVRHRAGHHDRDCSRKAPVRRVAVLPRPPTAGRALLPARPPRPQLRSWQRSTSGIAMGTRVAVTTSPSSRYRS